MKTDTSNSRRVVVKLGTQVVLQKDGGADLHRLRSIVNQCADSIQRGTEFLIVSSGAIGLGRQKLGLRGALSTAEKQACAAVGQGLLINIYNTLFADVGLSIAQVLLTADDLSDRKRYINIRETLESLLEKKVVPIINENDTVSVMEIKNINSSVSFGDNDKLSALVASKLGADLLILLTDVKGIYTDNPKKNPKATLIPVVDKFEILNTICKQNGLSLYGRGGIESKIEAARIASISGITTLIGSGFEGTLISDALSSEKTPLEATLIKPQVALPMRKRWIALVSGYTGLIVVNEGAQKAIVERQASLLPIGISDVIGTFRAGQVVGIQGNNQYEIGRGIVNFSSDQIRQILGKSSKDIATLLNTKRPPEEVIHRDNLVIFQES